jgi:hypothetical protein
MMFKLLWRTKFVISYRDILARPNSGCIPSIVYGWKVSNRVYPKLNHLLPKSAALLEITRLSEYD